MATGMSAPQPINGSHGTRCFRRQYHTILSPRMLKRDFSSSKSASRMSPYWAPLYSALMYGLQVDT